MRISDWSSDVCSSDLNIQKLTGTVIDVRGDSEPNGDKAAPFTEDRAPRSKRDERAKVEHKPTPNPKRDEPKSKRDEPKVKPARDEGRKAAPKPRDEQDGPDNGWTGPMPEFLSVGIGS